MRQLFVSVDETQVDRALAITSEAEAQNVSILSASAVDGSSRKLIALHLPNGGVEGFIDRLDELEGVEITLEPRGILALYPPGSEAADQVVDVEMRSPIEIILSGLQSIGSWRGFLSYAAASGIIVWIGLFTNTVYLLTAAMLIAPFAGPAMNLAIGTARGDAVLMRRSAGRYFAALGVTVFVAAVMSLLMRHDVPSSLMTEQSQVSSLALLLPLVAGAAGAMNLLQSERSSLVSGAAVGMLVAASIAPPAGLVGVAIALRDADLFTGGAFRLLLQLAAINLAGALVFRLGGISSDGARLQRGKPRHALVGATLSILVIIALLFVQFYRPPELTRATVAQRAIADIHDAVSESGLAHLIEADVRFTRADVEGQNSLLCILYVQPLDPASADDVIRRELSARVAERVRRPGVTPLVSVTVVEPVSPP